MSSPKITTRFHPKQNSSFTQGENGFYSVKKVNSIPGKFQRKWKGKLGPTDKKMLSPKKDRLPSKGKLILN